MRTAELLSYFGVVSDFVSVASLSFLLFLIADRFFEIEGVFQWEGWAIILSSWG